MASLILMKAQLAKAVANGDEVAIKRLRKAIWAEEQRRALKKGKKK